MELVAEWENDTPRQPGLSGVINEYRLDCPVDDCDGRLRATCPEEYEIQRVIHYESDQERVYVELPADISPRHVTLDRETCNGESNHGLGVKTFDPGYDDRRW